MKWGIMATGNIAHQFADTVKLLDGQEIAAVCSRHQETAEAFATAYHVPRAYESLEDFLADGDVEAVYVACPNLFHEAAVTACLQNGKPVLCEKPLTTSYAQSARLYALAKEKELFLMEAYWVPFLPAIAALQEQLPSIGRLTAIDLQYGFVASGPRRLTKLKPELGGGALMDIGIYALGFLQLVAGECPRFDDGVMERCEFGTDEACALHLSWAKGCKARVRLSVKEQIDRIAILTGTEGRIVLPDFQHAERFTVYPKDGAAKDFYFPEGRTCLEHEIEEAARCIRAGKLFSDRFTPQMSLDIIRLMDEIRQGWREGRCGGAN